MSTPCVSLVALFLLFLRDKCCSPSFSYSDTKREGGKKERKADRRKDRMDEQEEEEEVSRASFFLALFFARSLSSFRFLRTSCLLPFHRK